MHGEAADDLPHLLVVDDDTRLRGLLRRYLSENGYRITTAASADEARGALGAMAFDLLVLDIMMPGESGLELMADLHLAHRLPVLLLTARDQAEDRIAGLEKGADDYLVKPFEPRELLLRIGTILRRNDSPRDVAPRSVRLGAYAFDIAREELRRDGQPIHLTSNEASLLKVLALNAGVAMSRDELSARSRVGGNDRAVDVQVTRLRRKIEPDPKAPRYLQTVWGAGYILRPD